MTIVWTIGLVSRKRRRLSNGSTATDASQARLLHSKELDVQDRVIFAIYDFLWKKEENWDRIVDPVTEDVPDPAPSILIPDDPGLLEQVEAKFVDLTRIPGMENLKHLWLFPLRFLIREEYVIIDEFITSSEKSLLLLGQPGIGACVLYLLKKEFAQKYITFPREKNVLFKKWIFHKRKTMKI